MMGLTIDDVATQAIADLEINGPRIGYAYVKAEYLEDEIGNNYIQAYCEAVEARMNEYIQKHPDLTGKYMAVYDGDYICLELTEEFLSN